MSTDGHLRSEVYKIVTKTNDVISEDPYRLSYHLMPPVGLLNDPNGFIQYKGVYHLFYQWMPFKTGHGAKFWGHYSSTDLVHWKHEEIALTPSEWYEKNGCYSGSAIESNGEMYVFYTGNVKDEQGNRETYQCLAVSKDGFHFEKKGPVVELPAEYTAHFRDPKVWKQDDHYFMVVGAQTTDIKGAVALLRSNDMLTWNHLGVIAGGGEGLLADFGYMFECPDLFHLQGKDVLIFSPQGLEATGLNYQNVYQSGYVMGHFNSQEGSYNHGPFQELDRGFDFYAPQTTTDEKGRRILFAWMSVPDQNEQEHPTIKYHWLHNMTLPRELKVINNKVFQVPVKELEQLRVGEVFEHDVKLNAENREFEEVNGKTIEIVLEKIDVSSGFFSMSVGEAAKIIYSPKQGLFTLERQSYVDGVTEIRQCLLNHLDSMRIYLDTSSIEIFINGGEETFTARFYPVPSNNSVRFSSSEKSTFMIKKWKLADNLVC
ncbi:glycoside hydrolase family 32 protein [Bacillus suaedae]|uniref:Sucrose-6-phosphate hydrolase n=1 Tax=Halalkalibacter suaedae TaxID=2822140 RepID=A0A940WU13_9BACI|nr:sucrose-6-phosphate hydrolase [Bacillus suaedae]MBP3950437.1 sucrose-6-phosphate hydrolase [Bacillus suaedae]